MENDEIRKKIKEKFFKSMNLPLKAMPLWMEAIGVGVFISSILDRNPGFKEKLGEMDDKVFLFEARDITKSFYLHIKDREIKVIPHMKRPPDVEMRGDV